MQEKVMSCFGSCVGSGPYGCPPEETKRARLIDKQLTRRLHKYHREDQKKLKLLLLGTGESGKSTITKQMKIIHINGFNTAERMSKIADIKRNIKESILAILIAMQNLNINLEKEENRASAESIINHCENQELEVTDRFLEHTQNLWADSGIQECFGRSHEYQLIDCAKHFLDKIEEIRLQDYIPSDQDILRCRVITTSIQHIEFSVADSGQEVQFSVYDVGGQRGERKKWIQVFDSVVAILFLVDCGSFDQTLREDFDQNRLIEAMEIFEQVWNNRFLRYVSILLFLNKIDILAEKVAKGRNILELTERYPHIFQDYKTFTVTNGEKLEFMDNFPGGSDAPKRRGKASSRTDIHPEVIKTGVYIKNVFMQLARGDIKLRKSFQDHDKHWHEHHSCDYYYTCAVDTNNVTKVLTGCRTLIIRKHLERFGIL